MAHLSYWYLKACIVTSTAWSLQVCIHLKKYREKKSLKWQEHTTKETEDWIHWFLTSNNDEHSDAITIWQINLIYINSFHLNLKNLFPGSGLVSGNNKREPWAGKVQWHKSTLMIATLRFKKRIPHLTSVNMQIVV